MDAENIEIKPNFLSGSGNLFSVINNITAKKPIEFYSKNIRQLCFNSIINKVMDGLIVINSDALYDFNVWFFNSDGTTGMMCGNGGRCAVYYYANYIAYSSTNNKLLTFSMNGKVYCGSINDDKVCIYFNPPKCLPYKKIICIGDAVYYGIFVDVGTPHYIINVAELDCNPLNKIDIAKIGQPIRWHSDFAPGGTNVNFYQKNDATTLYLRTYERGVEGETGACGTGSIATALAYYQLNPFNFPLNIIPTSQSTLSVEFVFLPNAPTNLHNLKHIILGGSVTPLA